MMEKNGLKIRVLTPGGEVYSGDIESCMVPGAEGQFQVLDHHAPLLSIVGIGQIKIVDKSGSDLVLATSGGMCEVVENMVNLVVESAELAKDIDIHRAQESKKRAEARLKDSSAVDIDINRARASLSRALNRLKVGGK
jgi:F-type H+-transporting ATPase subunit epsilon